MEMALPSSPDRDPTRIAFEALSAGAANEGGSTNRMGRLTDGLLTEENVPSPGEYTLVPHPGSSKGLGATLVADRSYELGEWVLNTAVKIGEAGKCTCGEEMAGEGETMMVILEAKFEPSFSGEGRFKIGLGECFLKVARLGEAILVRRAVDIMVREGS